MKPQVIIVENTRTMRETLRLLLAGEFDCSVAESGEEGFAMMLAQPPDVLLSDVNMEGGMDGYELCRRVRLEPRLQQTRIAFLSGYPPRLSEPPDSQPDIYMMKPAKPSELIAQLMALLAERDHVAAPALGLGPQR